MSWLWISRFMLLGAIIAYLLVLGIIASEIINPDFATLAGLVTVCLVGFSAVVCVIAQIAHLLKTRRNAHG